MEKHALSAQPRTVLGRQVKKLRKSGILPANLYGKKIKSQSVSVPIKEFIQVYSETGETGLVEVTLQGKKLPVLIHNVTYHPITQQVLHADFYKVDLKEKVTANVPIEIAGESSAVKDKIGTLLTNLDELEIEALPQDLPERIVVDISGLKAVDDAVKIKDLKTSAVVKILADSELEVVKIAPLVSKEAQILVEEEKAAAAQAAEKEAQAAPTEAEVTATEKPTQEVTSQPQKEENAEK